MLEGVKIIAERIREFPEELPKWKHFMATQLTTMLTNEEIAHISDAINDTDRKDFNARVLDCLNDNEPKIRYKATERYATGWTDPRAFVSPQIHAEGQPIGYGDLELPITEGKTTYLASAYDVRCAREAGLPLGDYLKAKNII